LAVKKIRARIKTVVASSGSAEEAKKKLMIVQNKDKTGRRGKLRKKVTLLGYREIKQKVVMEREQEKYRGQKELMNVERREN
jgi:hypothetical protein